MMKKSKLDSRLKNFVKDNRVSFEDLHSEFQKYSKDIVKYTLNIFLK